MRCEHCSRGHPNPPYGSLSENEAEGLALIKEGGERGIPIPDIIKALEISGHKPRGSKWFPRSVRRILERLSSQTPETASEAKKPVRNDPGRS